MVLGGGRWRRLAPTSFPVSDPRRAETTICLCWFRYNVTPTAAYQYEPAYRRYGHKINAVHFIGPDKPWSKLSGRPAGVSQPKGKEANFDCKPLCPLAWLMTLDPSLVDRWYAVYDRHIRSTAAHHPDLAQRFAVPDTIAVWNRGVPHQPDDRLDLSELKSAAERGVTSLKSGQYISLPLEGRVDLMMSKPKPKFTLPPSTGSPTAIASPALFAPPPPSYEQQSAQPATWDASRESPPKTSGAEMLVPMNHHYAPAWDQPPPTQSAYYSTPHDESQYPDIPANVRSNEWYKTFTGSSPDRGNIQSIFPWEEGTHRRPDRVFPHGDSPAPSRGRHDFSISLREATPHVPSPPHETPPKTMQEAISSYTNAWDEMPSIQRYVNTITGTGARSSKREMNVMGLQSVPGTPRYETSSKRDLSTDRRSDVSGDGDDEDDEEDTIETNSSPSVGQSRESTFDLPLDFPSSARFRPRPQPMTPQAVPVPPLSAVPNKADRRQVTRQSSSSDTARPTPSLLTPVHDPIRPTVPAQYTSDSPEPRTSRIWDPSTDVDVRKRDTQNVLSRFMKVGGLGKEEGK